MKKRSWKTTAAGVVALAAIVIKYYLPEHAAFFNELVLAATAAGLIAARDNGVTSEDVGAKR